MHLIRRMLKCLRGKYPWLVWIQSVLKWWSIKDVAYRQRGNDVNDDRTSAFLLVGPSLRREHRRSIRVNGKKLWRVGSVNGERACSAIIEWLLSRNKSFDDSFEQTNIAQTFCGHRCHRERLGPSDTVSLLCSSDVPKERARKIIEERKVFRKFWKLHTIPAHRSSTVDLSI